MVLILFSDFTCFLEVYSNFAIKTIHELHKMELDFRISLLKRI